MQWGASALQVTRAHQVGRLPGGRFGAAGVTRAELTFMAPNTAQAPISSARAMAPKATLRRTHTRPSPAPHGGRRYRDVVPCSSPESSLYRPPSDCPASPSEASPARSRCQSRPKNSKGPVGSYQDTVTRAQTHPVPRHRRVLPGDLRKGPG